KKYMDPKVMEQLRGRIAALRGSGAPVTTTPPPVTTTPPKTNTPAVSDDDRYAASSRARRNLAIAKMKLERGPEGVEDELKNVEESRRIELGIKQDLDSAEQYVGTKAIDGIQERLAQAAEKLASPEAKKGLDPATARRLEARMAELGRRGPEAYKQAVFKETLPYLKKLEDYVAAEPFKGVRYAYPI